MRVACAKSALTPKSDALHLAGLMRLKNRKISLIELGEVLP